MIVYVILSNSSSKVNHIWQNELIACQIYVCGCRLVAVLSCVTFIRQTNKSSLPATIGSTREFWQLMTNK